MTRKGKQFGGTYFTWRNRDMANKYINRDTRRPPLPKAKVDKPVNRALYGCVGGPFDGQKVWLSGNSVQSIHTAEFTLGAWHGRYVFDTSAPNGSRKVVWQPTPRWKREDTP